MKLRFNRYKFILNSEISGIDHYFFEAAVRGGFGYILRKFTCALKLNNCESCMLKDKCIYSYIFETSPSADSSMMRLYNHIPHPFVFYCPRDGEKLTLELILIGKAVEYFPYFVFAIEELGKVGLTKNKIPFELESINLANNDVEIYNKTSKKLKNDYEFEVADLISNGVHKSVNELSLKFISPLRLMKDGSELRRFNITSFITALLRRLSAISYFHGEGELKLDYKTLKEKAGALELIEDNTRWHERERFSKRQDTKLKMGGLIGSVKIKGDISVFMPFLQAGEFLHTGKATSFGMGRYEILTRRIEHGRYL